MGVVQTLGPSAYVGFLEAIGEGQDARTHKALVRFPGDADAVDCYVKAYCTQVAPKGLVNELLGYVLTKHGGFDVPKRAAVICLDDEQAACFGNDIAPLKNSEGQVVAWCVESLDRPTPKTVYRLSREDLSGLPSLKTDLNKWADLTGAASFDAWVKNEDRNPGNLIRLAEGRYALIDHGRVCTGNAWAPPLDRSSMGAANWLAYWAWGTTAIENAPPNHHESLVSSLDRHANALSSAEVDIDYWLDALVSSQEKEDAEGFLSDRVVNLKQHLQSSFGMLSL